MPLRGADTRRLLLLLCPLTRGELLPTYLISVLLFFARLAANDLVDWVIPMATPFSEALTYKLG